MSPNCPARQASTVAPQSLLMLNDTFIAQQARFFAERIESEHPGDARGQINRAWRLAYGVGPSDQEMLSSLVYMAEQAEQIRAHLAVPGKPVKSETTHKPEDPVAAVQDTQTLALASLCQALLCANRFLYID
jgi:hypothetical protein